MPSTPTQPLRLEQQAFGENENTWGDDRLNRVIRVIADAIAGVAAVSVSVVGGAVSLTAKDYESDQARKPVLILSGTLLEDTKVTVPDETKLYVIDNRSTGPHTLTIGTASGTPITLLGGVTLAYCDGLDMHVANPTDYGGARLRNLGVPTDPSDAVRKDTPLQNLGAPTAAVDANAQRIVNLGTPTGSKDATSKEYVDQEVLKSSAGVLPGQPGNKGKVLSTDGTNANWRNQTTPETYFLAVM